MPSRSREAAASTKKKRRRSPLPWILLVLVAVVGGYRLYTGYFPWTARLSAARLSPSCVNWPKRSPRLNTS